MEPVVIHEANPGRYRVQRSGIGGWNDHKSHSTKEAAIEQADRLAHTFPDDRYRVIDTQPNQPA